MCVCVCVKGCRSATNSKGCPRPGFPPASPPLLWLAHVHTCPASSCELGGHATLCLGSSLLLPLLLQVGKLSPEAQAVILKYTSQQAGLPPAMAIAAMLTRTLPWPTPCFADYQTLLQESEYAAW